MESRSGTGEWGIYHSRSKDFWVAKFGIAANLFCTGASWWGNGNGLTQYFVFILHVFGIKGFGESSLLMFMSAIVWSMEVDGWMIEQSSISHVESR